MNTQLLAVEAYKNALANNNDETALAAAAEALADDIVVLTNFGTAQGRDAALALFKNPTIARLVASAQWLDPSLDGNTATVTARLPATAPVGGFEFVFEFGSNGRIRRVEQQMLPAAPLEAVDLRLTEGMKAAIDGALDNGTPIIAAYVDEAGQVRVSFRGTTQTYSDHQLALWARNPQGGMPRNIAKRPKVTLFYHDPKSRTTYTFYGDARIVNDEAARRTIFDHSHPREQHMDFRRKGVAIVVDLNKVEGRGPGGRVLMERK